MEREALLVATEADLAKIPAAARWVRQPLRGKDKITPRAGKAIGRQGDRTPQSGDALHYRERLAIFPVYQTVQYQTGYSGLGVAEMAVGRSKSGVRSCGPQKARSMTSMV